MTLRSIGMVSAAALLAVLVGAPTFSAAADEKNIEELVQNAKTAADHEAIASYYDAEAAAAKKKAAEHQQMGESYKAQGSAIGKGLGASSMPQHCETLTKSFEQEAAQYQAMAKVHRDLAKAAK